MAQLVNLPDAKKLEILNRHCITGPRWRKLDDVQWCLHCGKTFSGRSVRVYRDADFHDGYSLECGTPGCNGSPIDWHHPNSDFAVGVTVQYAADQASPDGKKAPTPTITHPDLDYEDCGEYGPEIEIRPEYRDEAQRQRFRAVLWEEPDALKKAAVHRELRQMLCIAAKEALRGAFAEHFGAAWMEQWGIVFRARVDGWADDPADEVIQVEVEFASMIEADGSDEQMDNACGLIDAKATETALLGDLQDAIIAYLNLYAPELVNADEQLKWKMEITGYGGG